MTREVLITGAASDIGIAICLQYLFKGYRVLGLYNKGKAALTHLAKENSNLTLYPLDFTSPENIENFIQAEKEGLLACDTFVHAAAIVEPVQFSELSADKLLRAFTINVIPSILFTRTLTPAMVKRGWGRIVNLSSIGVKFGGGSKTFPYSLSKHALEIFPQEHKTWAASNVLINTIRIGVTDTRMHKADPEKNMDQRVTMIPMKRMATPDEMAKVVYWLGSEQNSFMTGQVIAAAGGE